MNTNPEPGPLAEGWRLLWHTQRVLWGIYAVNLVLGLFSAFGFALRVGHVLNHSLAAQRLYHGFDLAYFVELAANPEVQLATRPASSLGFAIIFLIFMLFATGGVLDTFTRHRTLVPGEFFQGCGAFFWRFVRLMLWLMAALIPVAILTMAITRWSGHLSEYAAHARTGFWVEIAGCSLVVLLLMTLRLWFDMAQVQVVVEDERRMTRSLGRAFRLTFTNFSPLFSMYFRLSLLAWAGTGLTFWFWIKLVRAEDTGLIFLSGQFVAWLWLATRLWLRAAEVVWYQRQRPAPPPLVIPDEEREPEIPKFATEPPTET